MAFEELRPEFDELAGFVGTVLAAIVAGMHRAGTIDADVTIGLIKRLGESDTSSQQGSFQGFAAMAEAFCKANPPRS